MKKIHLLFSLFIEIMDILKHKKIDKLKQIKKYFFQFFYLSLLQIPKYFFTCHVIVLMQYYKFLPIIFSY